MGCLFWWGSLRNWGYWPNIFGKQSITGPRFVNIIIPHHGAYGSLYADNYGNRVASTKKILKRIFNRSNNMKAIICNGNSEYAHPCKTVTNMYRDIGFKDVLETKTSRPSQLKIIDK